MLRRDRELTRTVRRRLDALTAPGSGSPPPGLGSSSPDAAVPERPRGSPGWVPGQLAGQVAGPSPVPGSTTEPGPLPARTTAALRTASDGYAAVHGSPLTPAPRGRRLRWAVSWRAVGAASVAVLVVGGGVGLRAASTAPGPPVTLPVPAPEGTSGATDAPIDDGGAPAVVVVDVVGAVAAPGVVRLPGGSRVVDAVAAVGGATADADLGAINLARVLVDGEQVVVPRPGAGSAAGTPADPAGGDARVDLNTADAADLDALPGVGPVIAARIIAHRQQGPFTSVDELGDVSGIGPTLLERLRDLVRV